MRTTTTAVVAAILVAASPAAASATTVGDNPTSCRARNASQDLDFRGASALHDAIETSAPGDGIRARGTCKGTYVVDHALSIRKMVHGTYPVLDGDQGGTTLTITDGARVQVRTAFVINGSDSAIVVDEGARLVLKRARVRESSSPTDGGLVRNAGDLRVVGTTLEHGDAAGRGGAIFNSGTLTTEAADIAFNTAGGNGGGIASTGSAVIVGSIVTNNTAGAPGGGIFSSGTVELVDTAVAGNLPDNCAGVAC